MYYFLLSWKCMELIAFKYSSYKAVLVKCQYEEQGSHRWICILHCSIALSIYYAKW